MTDPEPKTFTQDEVNSLLADAKRKHREEFDTFKATVADYDDIKSQVAALTTERDTLAATSAESEKRATTAEVHALRYDVAAEADLPLSLAPRLTGSTKEELLADATKLKSLIPTQAPKSPTPTAPPAPKPGAGKGRAAEALRGVVRDRA